MTKIGRSLFSNNQTLFNQDDWKKHQQEILEKAEKYESKHFGIDPEVEITLKPIRKA